MIPRKTTANLFAADHRSRWARVMCLWLAAMAMGVCSGVAWAAGSPVAEVSLAIGVSRLIDEDGRSSAIVRGMPVHAGERVETEQGGHVHLRFIDGAFVSVRPGSRLVIETYRYDPARPKDSAIRFTLELGVARAISGKGAEAARERFRLNTPIAAIGVRGTDFVVLAGPEWVRVAINSGAIVLSPLGEGCLAAAFGPCNSAGTSTLSADMGKVVLDYQLQQGAPRLVPINGTPSPDRVNPPAPGEPRSVAGSRGKLAADPNGELLAVQAVSEAQGQAFVPPEPSQTPPPVTGLPPATLVWGRWTAPLPGDSISASYEEARAGRTVTVGNSYFALFRPELPQPVLISDLGRVDFSLRDAQVWLLQGGLQLPGTVDNAWLSVNFGQRQFATSVDMSQAAAGVAASLQVGGTVREDGLFAVKTGDGSTVAGAFTLDGKEAGYFFEKPVTAGAGGTFTGITRWAR